jgi:superfamily II DNA helicase RecQ
MNYDVQISGIAKPSFDKIRDVAFKQISHLSKGERNQLFNQLKRGVAILENNELLCQYLYSFGKMHQAKLLHAFARLPLEILTRPFEIIDWGCGQGLGTINLFDFISSEGLTNKVQKVTLIEPSKAALHRAVIHTKVFVEGHIEIVTVNSYFESINKETISSQPGVPVIHVFSNILDVEGIDLKYLAELIGRSIESVNYVVCVGPLNPTNQRIDAFFRYFNVPLLYAYDDHGFIENAWTIKCRIFKLEANAISQLIEIKYYPPVPFQAMFELDCIRDRRKKDRTKSLESLVNFEVAAPFDLGASIYDDVHPILAVLHNIIVRGLPTRCSPYVEEKFSQSIGGSTRSLQLGEIEFTVNHDLQYEQLIQRLEAQGGDWVNDREESVDDMLRLLVPVGIARFQKVLVEALITEHLVLDQKKWKILVKEVDVPFAAIAIKDFEHMFNHLTQLSQDFESLKFPEIDLHVIGHPRFADSGLHLDANVYVESFNGLRQQVFDMVLTMSTYSTSLMEFDNFSEFKCANNCYFHVRSTPEKHTSRVIYTSDLIKYKNVVERNNQGVYNEIEETQEHLKFLMQLLFRKETFRPGQLPILDRALSNLPVIGLLPTGGGKSLTYQLAAILQPGVTMIIDPLKALMDDQYKGLLDNGIDACSYINSDIGFEEKIDREKRLKSSQLLFVFLSPERLSIDSFRRSLAQMQNYNVYFSYGVIDEVHCVSEWGHDFRFSYLHLGRNLYNYVKPKEGNISLFGLTATASFDVLADVERELSGNGAFNLDSETIVRYENTNRLELQYRIQKVPVTFATDQYYDKYNKMPSHLPKAINISNHWSTYDSKRDFLPKYVKQLPAFFQVLNTPLNTEQIRHSFIERQNIVEDLEPPDICTLLQQNFYRDQIIYKEAGIVFCPHVGDTGLSVEKNTSTLSESLKTKIGSFTGADNDGKSATNMEAFRKDLLPVMVATKAFGMGIDKPNVRFTINMNYSSSLEAFVQEAGRAGRDRKMALASILFSDYRVVQIKREFENNTFPLGIIKNKWFHENDLSQILNFYRIQVPEEFLRRGNPEVDLVKLHCSIDNRMFAYKECNSSCTEYQNCKLRLVNHDSHGWKTENELIQELMAQGLVVSRKNFQFMSADYQAVLYFFNDSFKGDAIERSFMEDLLTTKELRTRSNVGTNAQYPDRGLLESLLKTAEGDRFKAYIPYNFNNQADLSKAIYRMCCIDLIDNFTQDYRNQEFCVTLERKSNGEYYEGLKQFLRRYYTEERAEKEIAKAKRISVSTENNNPLNLELLGCFHYLTSFIYDKISEKRKRAIDDMRNFCLAGLNPNKDWIELNEELKDFIYYYFNSKYAKPDYVAENGQAYSLLNDTDSGRVSDISILYKYLRIIEDDIVGVGTPLDNVKHLYGAVRLISRSLTDANPVLSLLEVFCLAYLGVTNSENLMNQMKQRYFEAMLDLYSRREDYDDFWTEFVRFNMVLSTLLSEQLVEELTSEANIIIHSNQVAIIANKYLDKYE